MKVDGRCFCGFVTFAAEIDPAQVIVCHCTDCQTLSSSAFRVTVPAQPGTFKLLSGELKTYVKTADSGNRRALAFCPNCGTSIYSAPTGEMPRDTYFGLRVGTLLQRDHLPPKAQCWVGSRQHWVDPMAALTPFDKE
jgi:hypothetical protein